VLGFVLDVALYRPNKTSCTDFVAKGIEQDPGQQSRFADMRVVREDFPEGKEGL